MTGILAHDSTLSLPAEWLIREDATTVQYRIPDERIKAIAETLLAFESRLVWIFCTEEAKDDSFVLWYVFELAEMRRYLVLVQNTQSPVSLVNIYPAASRFERAITDGFGLQFAGSPDSRRLFLHEAYPDRFHPLRKSVKNAPITVSDSQIPFEFRSMEGTGVYQVPVGPVHAGIIEPGHFRFSVIGEDILNLEIRLGYLHRGIEKLAEGCSPEKGVRIAESVSGDESVANACCYAMAVEQILSVQVPPRAVWLRALLLELERSWSLLSDLAGMVTDVAFSTAASRFLILRETLQRVCERLTGSRFLKGVIGIGGITHDIPDDLLMEVTDMVMKVRVDLEGLLSWVLSVPSVIDRFSTTGVVREPLIDPLALSGPVARASGRALDVRSDHPYGLYKTHPIPPVTRMTGDVLGRFALKGDEVLASLAYISELVTQIPAGRVQAEYKACDGYALAMVESPRGRTLCYVRMCEGSIDRFALSTASFCNWMALEHAVLGNIVPDFPVINKSMNLSYAGTDL